MSLRGSKRRTSEDEHVISVTDAQPGHSEDLDSRIVRYAWMMSIRIVCFLLAVLTPSPWRWMFVVAAVFLPYFAVVMANARRSKRTQTPQPFTPMPHPEIDTKS
jgi:Flp pilus assembly protein TadB